MLTAKKPHARLRKQFCKERMRASFIFIDKNAAAVFCFRQSAKNLKKGEACHEKF